MITLLLTKLKPDLLEDVILVYRPKETSLESSGLAIWAGLDRTLPDDGGVILADLGRKTAQPVRR